MHLYLLRTFLSTLVLTIGTIVGTGPAMAACGPALTGQPCAWGGATIQGASEPGLNLGVGNPIHLLTGNKYQHEIDLPGNRYDPLLELERHYNSLDPRRTHFGQGWSLSYDSRLYQVGNSWQIVQADGSRRLFTSDAHGNPQPNRQGRLQRHASGGWLWLWPSGESLLFNTQGQLSAVRHRNHHLAIIRHAKGPLQGAIKQVESASGQQLGFHYLQLGKHFYIQFIDTPAGRFHYQYAPLSDGSGHQLKSLTRPDGMRRFYGSEPQQQAGNQGLLTRIEIHSADRQQKLIQASWSYDAQRRAIRYTPGPHQPARQALQLRYGPRDNTSRKWQTVVTTPYGTQHHLEFEQHQGQYRPLKHKPTTCKTCPSTRQSKASNTVTEQHTCSPCTNQHALPHTNQADHHQVQPMHSALRWRTHPSGNLAWLQPAASGWPGLQMHYNPQGRRSAWFSEPTGTETSRFKQNKQLVQRRFANDDLWRYRYDHHGRLQHLTLSGKQSQEQIRLLWKRHLPVKVQSRHETEIRHYQETQPGAIGKLTSKTVIRYPQNGQRIPLLVQDRFTHHALQGKMRHTLPEGGSLIYRYDAKQRPIRIDWVDRQGLAHRLLDSTPGQAGYRYANGLQLQVLLHKGQARLLELSNGQQPLWTVYQDYDAHKRLSTESYRIHPGSRYKPPASAPAAASSKTYEQWHYRYDTNGALLGATNTSGQHYYAWKPDGASLAIFNGKATIRPAIRRDASGLPNSVQDYRAHYGPNRRLRTLMHQGKMLAHYRHNAWGQRISTRNASGTSHFFYLDNRVVAEARTSIKHPAHPTITRRYVYANNVPVGLIDYTEARPNGVLYAIHADLTGTPRLITDSTQTIRWLATYTPTGRATRIAGDLEFDLRLPGQLLDRTTGWHDNLWRTYLPDHGQFLEPDPLGPVPDTQVFGYAAQQPRRFIDPSGLLLFAFDGTRNSPITQSNVWKMSQRYLDGPSFYHSGPGNPYSIDWGALTGSGAEQILDAQWQRLLDELAQSPPSSGDTIPLDIVGFSRGAALARHFANQINTQVNQGLFSYNDPLRGLITACVDLRFMGLFDTVTQFGLVGSQNAQFDFSIASSWAWVAHAVALQERRWLFPLTAASSSPQGNIVEAPFIGAHADIGGGLAVQNRRAVAADSDLPNVALNWMLWQARAATLRFSDGPLTDAEINQPIVHDDRSSTARTLDTDRRVDAPDGQVLQQNQGNNPDLGQAQRKETEALIQRYDGWRNSNERAVGEVDMDGYARWLYETLGWQAAPA